MQNRYRFIGSILPELKGYGTLLDKLCLIIIGFDSQYRFVSRYIDSYPRHFKIPLSVVLRFNGVGCQYAIEKD